MDTRRDNFTRPPIRPEGVPVPEPANTSPPPVIPDHELIRQVGSGSYGSVWLARNAMGVYRAVKIVSRATFSDQKPFERELSGIQKFEPISRSHEGFIDVLHVGINREQGFFYYVMEVGDDQITGQNIDPANYNPKTLGKEIAQHRQISFRECLELGLGLSQALAELHKHGLVHRDVKPSNIVYVNGVPKLADIGLVAEFHEARSYVGTEGFIPPEGPGAPQADVYGLGKVLYEASTGKDRKDFPALPTILEDIPERNSFMELNEVILHACKNEVSQRYPSAWDMYADLLVLANGKSVKRLKVLERRLANLKRIIAASLVFAALLGIIAYQVYRARKAVGEARQREDIKIGYSEVNVGDLLGALPSFADLVEVDGASTNRDTPHRLEFGSVLAQCPKLSHFWAEPKPVNTAEFSPDGQSILIAQDAGEARIYNINSGSLYLHPFGHRYGIYTAAYSHDGQFVATGSEDWSVCIWDVATLTEVCRLRHPDGVYCVRFSPDGRRLITGCADGYARVWNLQTQKVERMLKHSDFVRFADFSSDGALIVTSSQDGTAKIWDALTGLEIGEPLSHENWVYYASFSPDRKQLVTASGDRTARVWDLATRRQISPDLLHDDWVMTAEFSPDGRYIVTASLDNTVRFWNTTNYKPAAPNAILPQGERVTHATFDKEGRRLLVTCADGSVRLWDLACSMHPIRLPYSQISPDGRHFLGIRQNIVEVQPSLNGRQPPKQIVPDGILTEVAFNHTGNFIMTISTAASNTVNPNNLLQVWNTDTAQAIGAPLSMGNSFSNAILSDDGRQAILIGDANAQIWDLAKQRPVSPLLVHQASMRLPLFSPNGQLAITASNKIVYVWRASDGAAAFAPLTNAEAVKHVEFSRDGSRLATSCSTEAFDKCYAQVWDAFTGKPIGPPLYHRDGVLFVTFSPDGRRVATAGEDFSVIIWETETGRQIAVLRHRQTVNRVDFSRDGKEVLSVSGDGTVCVWNAENGDPLTPLLRHNKKVANAVFLDNNRVGTVDIEGKTFIWDLPVERRRAQDLKKIARLLSPDTSVFSAGSHLTNRVPLETLWLELKDEYPADFTASPEEISAWHEFEAEAAERNGQWSAAIFHWEYVSAIRPDDALLKAHLVRVNSIKNTGK